MTQRATHWVAGSHRIDLSTPVVMGILNVTPDSFSNQGEHFDTSTAIAHAERMIAEGAGIIDIGAESSRPGAEPLPLDEELRRLLPVLRAVVPLGVPVSIDTYKTEVMRRAIDLGAVIINDINALRAPGAVGVVAASQAGVCLMHMLGEPKTMQADPVYHDVVTEVQAFLQSRVQTLASAGVDAARIAIDPGFGFGKRNEDNLALFRATPAFVDTGFPVVIGVSRKSMIARWSNRPDARPAERVSASVTAAVLAAQAGAQIVRVHDVRDTVDALALLRAVVPRDGA